MTACSAVTFMLREAAKDVSRCRCEYKRLLEGRLVFEHAPKASGERQIGAESQSGRQG